MKGSVHQIAKEYAEKTPWQVDAETLEAFANLIVRKFIERVEASPSLRPEKDVFREMFGEWL